MTLTLRNILLPLTIACFPFHLIKKQVRIGDPYPITEKAGSTAMCLLSFSSWPCISQVAYPQIVSRCLLLRFMHHSQFTWAYCISGAYSFRLFNERLLFGYQRRAPSIVFQLFSPKMQYQWQAKATSWLLRVRLTRSIPSSLFLFDEKCDA